MWNHRIRTTYIRTIKIKSFQQWPMIEMEHIRIEFTTMIIITIEIALIYQNTRDYKIFSVYLFRGLIKA